MLRETGVLEGTQVRANLYVETFEPTTAAPVLLHGSQTAGCLNRVGEGTAILLGTFVGHNGTAYRNPGTAEFVRTLTGLCWVAPEHPGQLLLRKRVGRGAEAWVFTNPTDGEMTEEIDVSGYQDVRDLLGEAPDRTGDTVTLTVAGLDVRVLVVRK